MAAENQPAVPTQKPPDPSDGLTEVELLGQLLDSYAST